MLQTREPIFLHSAWRTSKTWLWEKFRRLDGTMAFYEPCHEILSGLTPRQVAGQNEKGWASGHPELLEPYYQEYLPHLRPEGGMPGYRQRFALDAFFMDAGDDDPEQAVYLRGLVGIAVRERKQAVLGFSRTTGRIGWMKRQLGGVHLLLVRDFYRQWMSFVRLWRRHGHAYFHTAYFQIAGQNRRHPLLRALADRLALPDVRTGNFIEENAIYQRLYAGAVSALGYEVFLRVQVAAYLHAGSAADLVLDTDAAASGADLAPMEETLRARTGLSVDLGDFVPAPVEVQPEDEACLEITEQVLREVEAGIFPASRAGTKENRAWVAALLRRSVTLLRAAPRVPAEERGMALCLQTREQEILALRARIGHVQDKLEAMRRSVAWRITLPLRLVYRTGQRLGTFAFRTQAGKKGILFPEAAAVPPCPSPSLQQETVRNGRSTRVEAKKWTQPIRPIRAREIASEHSSGPSWRA